MKKSIKNPSLFWVERERNPLLCYNELSIFLLKPSAVMTSSRHTLWIWRQNEVPALGAQSLIWEESGLEALIRSQRSSRGVGVAPEQPCPSNQGPKANSTKPPVSINNWLFNMKAPTVTFPSRNYVLLRELEVEGSLLGQVEHELLQNASSISIISWPKREILKGAHRKVDSCWSLLLLSIITITIFVIIDFVSLFSFIKGRIKKKKRKEKEIQWAFHQFGFR